MKLGILAIDYDGTLASGGQLDPSAGAAVAWAREQGLVVVLVTGRTLFDLRRLLGRLARFDAIVAENGAVNVFTGTGHSSLIAPPYNPQFLAALRARGVEVTVGESVLDIHADACQVALDIIRELQLPLSLHFNRSRLMVLPHAVSKATGLRHALRTMRLSPHNAIGIGDAENDHELLAACEIGAAVAWGSSALQQAADVVIPGEGPADLGRWIREVAGRTSLEGLCQPRRCMTLGSDATGSPVSMGMRGRNILVAGDPKSGKSWMVGLLCEQLIVEGYCTVVLDPEGDYAALERLPGVRLLGGDAPVPTVQELTRILAHADVSVVVDLVRMTISEKQVYIRRTLRALHALRRETGLPHRIVVDEAHYFLADEDEAGALDHELAGYILVTYRVSGLHPALLAATDSVFVMRETDQVELDLLYETWGSSLEREAFDHLLKGLGVDEAVLMLGGSSGQPILKRFQLAPRITRHVRHRHKYLDIPVDDRHLFHFRFDDGAVGPTVGTLTQLVEALETGRGLHGHALRHDLSRWIEHVFGDTVLADRVRELERRHAFGTLPDFAGAVIRLVQDRYGSHDR